MGDKEVTTFETVERTHTVKVCDSCGTSADELPEDYGEFRTVWIDAELLPPHHPDGIEHMEVAYCDHGRRGKYTVEGAMIGVGGDLRDLCPICWGSVFA